MQYSRQITYWGSIDWVLNSHATSDSSMRIGIINVEPGKSQMEHVHFSDEQFLYTLCGTGNQYINRQCHPMSPGSFFHCPPGVFHATDNLGDDTLRQIFVSVPIRLTERLVKPIPDIRFSSGSIPDEVIEGYLLDVVSTLREQLFSSLNVPITVYSFNFKPLLRGDLPQVCQKHCYSDSIQGICPMSFDYSRSHGFDEEECSAVICPFGRTVLLQTISLGDHIIGYIQAGNFDASIDVPETTVNALHEILSEISIAIQRYCTIEVLQHDLELQQDAIEKTRHKSAVLNYALEMAQDRALHVQIKNHFLFNTLNSIASIALRDGSIDTYEAIIDLSNLFRGMLRKEGSMLPLSEEMMNMERYINLQRLHYGANLCVVFNRNPKAEEVIVPFNCLQPILENCFVHAFKDMSRQKKLSISSQLRGNAVIVSIKDNGCGISERTRANIESSIVGKSNHGISMANRSLQHLFGKQFEFNIESKETKGTTFKIVVPFDTSITEKAGSQLSSKNEQA